ncbi:MAG: 3'-5' exonuclease, partial [Burkholderiaceae bacterium]|nr:3'-5' exonuclease [Burkholderiaceae bacterium]
LAVGDDDQSIYAFRGARVGNMADFVREFNVGAQIKLEQNYRSHSNILDSANHLIGHNSQRLGKNLRTDQGAGEPVRVFESPTDFDEARWVVDEVRHLVRGMGDQPAVPRHEIALLYRSNAQSRVLETALFNAGVAYKVYGGLRFFERAEIKHALAYLRLLENVRDDTSFLRVVNFPPRGIGARSIEQLQDVARSSGCALADAVSAVGGRAGAGLSAFLAKLEVLRETTQGQTLRDIVQAVLDHSGLLAHFKADKDGADRVENLEELVNAAESFVMNEGFGRDAVGMSTSDSTRPVALSQSPASQGLLPEPAVARSTSHSLGTALDDALADANAQARGAERDGDQGGFDFDTPIWADPVDTGQMVEPLDAPMATFPEDTGETLSPLAAFLSHAALEAGDNQAQAGQDAVQLMTVHAAKGLEFDCVFITGLEEGLFPHENSASDRAGLEEERRLMYVAITRARKRLYLSHSQTRMLHGQTRYNARSRFFDELPEACLRWLTPKAGGGFGGLAGGGFGGGAWGGNFSRAEKPYPSSAGGHLGFKSAATPVFDAGPPLEPKSGRGTDIAAGRQVFHTKFGEGKVLTVEGAGADARAQINFPRHGVKWLALAVAKLTVVED